MRLDALLAYLHYLAIFMTAFFLLLEWARCRVPVDDRRARVLFRNDLGYFLSAMAALATGLARLFYGIKGPAFYLANPAFHAKLALFVLVALLSVGPTLAYRRWNRGFAGKAGYAVSEREVRRARFFLAAQIGVLALIPAAAVLMRGRCSDCDGEGEGGEGAGRPRSQDSAESCAARSPARTRRWLACHTTSPPERAAPGAIRASLP